ncbi:lantibiotic dehydratase family protein [Flavobacterium hungaricum]|uniref:Lantibiotic dehydratase N-terminal domain-containing protein n=1 Tax=Flavobacterium hungaricum TaxID=2082725 RepID=A0ABR9TGT3_9FLAO|nr:lantibiotic dehydratase family protein [Flavobacterium hungaricum]MBE8724577.1 hypothetical protein [Flavobacterium hungaricum]
MAKNFKLISFDAYVLRTPLFPLSLYLDTVENYSLEKAKKLYQDPLIREAIYLASPILVKELDKWAKASIETISEKNQRLEFSFLKYLARMSSRCTPFGLFSGCSVGYIRSDTSIVIENPDKFKRYTQFDMQFWIKLLQQISDKKEIMPYLQYYPNNSIYKIGDFYRYIEYKNIEKKREHSIAALRKSETLTDLLNFAKGGITIDDLSKMLACNEGEKFEAKKFVLKLIEFQFLVSELDATVTGNNDWERILSVVKKSPFCKIEYQILNKIQKKVSLLDKTLAQSEKKYLKIKNDIDTLGIGFDEKYLFQTDLYSSTLVNTLSKNVVNKVTQAISFLNSIQPKEKSQNLENFKKAFIGRYEYESMPLAAVLDTEIGIGYIQKHDMNDSHEILNFLSLDKLKAKEENQIWTSYDYVLQRKLQKSILEGNMEIVLEEKDFDSFNNDLSWAPPTCSVLIEVLANDKIVIESSGNISAAKLLGRFCNGSPSIHNLTKEIIQKEEGHYQDKIMAEITHIPESRTGNILRRPVLRNYEISYLAKSGVEEYKNIDLTDLYVSIENDSVKLTSKKYNKEVIPCLSNAHVFSKNSLPIYHFLCDLQGQHLKPIYSFDWGILKHHYFFFPRVLYKEIILSKARWTVEKHELSALFKIKDKNLHQDFLKWRHQRNVPRYVNWVNFDNTLLFDLDSRTGIEMFLRSAQTNDILILEEFLFVKNTVVQNQNNNDFSNQIIVSFHKEEK